MKYIAGLCGVVLMFLVGGCAVQEPYGGGYGVYGEYPYSYGYTAAPVYVYPDYHYRYAPYDRDHYWDRRHYWDRHRYPYRDRDDWRH